PLDETKRNETERLRFTTAAIGRSRRGRGRVAGWTGFPARRGCGRRARGGVSLPRTAARPSRPGRRRDAAGNGGADRPEDSAKTRVPRYTTASPPASGGVYPRRRTVPRGA